jgi:hypothetical protein
MEEGSTLTYSHQQAVNAPYQLNQAMDNSNILNKSTKKKHIIMQARQDTSLATSCPSSQTIVSTFPIKQTMAMDTFSLRKQTKDSTPFSRSFMDTINPTMQGKPLQLFKLKTEEIIHEEKKPEENITEPNIPTFNRFLKPSKLCEEPFETDDISTNSMARNITSRTISLDPTTRINHDLKHDETSYTRDMAKSPDTADLNTAEEDSKSGVEENLDLENEEEDFSHLSSEEKVILNQISRIFKGSYSKC